jgi:hypothetical protein
VYLYDADRLASDTLFPDAYDVEAHSYVTSPHNIAVERSWRRLRLDFGDDMVAIFQKGIDDGVYNPGNELQS